MTIQMREENSYAKNLFRILKETTLENENLFEFVRKTKIFSIEKNSKNFNSLKIPFKFFTCKKEKKIKILNKINNLNHKEKLFFKYIKKQKQINYININKIKEIKNKDTIINKIGLYMYSNNFNSDKLNKNFSNTHIKSQSNPSTLQIKLKDHCFFNTFVFDEKEDKNSKFFLIEDYLKSQYEISRKEKENHEKSFYQHDFLNLNYNEDKVIHYECVFKSCRQRFNCYDEWKIHNSSHLEN